MAIPFAIIYIVFAFDNKVHNKDQLIAATSDIIPIIAEVPHIDDKLSLNQISTSSSRNALAESIRMLVSNLNYSLINLKSKTKTVLVTSSVKGEGKTIISMNLANSLTSNNKKVILVGADLRNPQLHKYLNIDKNQIGLSNLIYKNSLNEYKNHIVKSDNLDILLSGAIPPNPTEILSNNFSDFIDLLKEEYDYIIIDSAPCLLVSDTFEIADLVDSTVYIFRANHTEKSVCNYIMDIYKTKKFKNLNLVLNGVGSSSSYGYKYGYQYGYQYGYKYGYNYGYGYGYVEDKS